MIAPVNQFKRRAPVLKRHKPMGGKKERDGRVERDIEADGWNAVVLFEQRDVLREWSFEEMGFTTFCHFNAHFAGFTTSVFITSVVTAPVPNIMVQQRRRQHKT
jgi:hypothetical protein